MSLFQCLDLIDKEIQHFSKTKFRARHKETLKDFRNKLNAHRSNLDVVEYDALIVEIESYISNKNWLKKNSCLAIIVHDLKTIQKKFNSRPTVPTFDPPYPEYLIAYLEQCSIYQLGISKGECGGFTDSMVLPSSPYSISRFRGQGHLTQPKPRIQFDETIHSLQKDRRDREKDNQKMVQRIRLTRKHFCPDLERQAEEIFNVVQKNAGIPLSLNLFRHRPKIVGHACYIKLTEKQNGSIEIEYADSNVGCYLFEGKAVFIKVYKAIANTYKTKKGIEYRFYSFSKLQYVLHPHLPEFNTFEGKIRSLLTGAKYDEGENIVQAIALSIYSLLGVGMGINLPSPGLLFCLWVNLTLFTFASIKGHRGLLTIPHFLQDSWYSFKQNKLDSDSSILQEVQEESTKNVIRLLGLSESPRSMSHSIEPYHRVDRSLRRQEGIFCSRVNGDIDQPELFMGLSK